MSESYDDWSLARLQKEVAKLQKLIEQREKLERKAALAEVRAVARKNGFSLDELLEEEGAPRRARAATPTESTVRGKKTAARKSGKKGVARYQNPLDPQQTWSGRGRKPGWVNEHLAKGGQLEELLIRFRVG